MTKRDFLSVWVLEFGPLTELIYFILCVCFREDSISSYFNALCLDIDEKSMETAKILREKGNELYTKKQIKQAISLYNEVLIISIAIHSYHNQYQCNCIRYIVY